MLHLVRKASTQRVAAAMRARFSTSSLVQVERGSLTAGARGEVGMAVVSMANKPVNALSPELISELTHTLQELKQDDSVEGAILCSEFPNVFSAGLMLTELAAPEEARLAEYWASFEGLWKELYMSPLATVAEITGAAPAGGAILALSCDHRTMSDSPKCCIGLTEVMVGLTLPHWGIQLMERTVGARNTEAQLGKGLLLRAEDALRTGWVDEIVPAEDVRARTEQRLSELLAMPPQARSGTKQMMRGQVAALSGPASVQGFMDSVQSQECQQVVTGMLEQMAKRKKK